jgi:hypothetical protein
VILFSWATGGNHVANMMTTSKKMEQRGDLERAYKNPTGDGVHTGDIISVGWRTPEYIIKRITSSVRSRIFPCHFGCLNLLWKSHLEPYLQDARCVVLEWDEHSYQVSRPNKWEVPTEPMVTYNAGWVKNHFGFDTLGIPIQDLFQPCANSVWERISDHWDLKLDFAKCEYYHNIWFNKIIQK